MKRDLAAFYPNWISSPGATVLDILIERNCSVAEFAAATHRSSYDVAQLLTGVASLKPDWADDLVATIGASKDFWLRREAQYRREIARLSADADHRCLSKWLNELPINDMIRNGWIEQADTAEELAHKALAFFGVPSVPAWRHTYGNVLDAAAYRTSLAYEVHPGAEATWLRQGEIQARAIDCAPWSKQRFVCALPKIRELTCEPDPSVFLPKLEAICAQAGIALVITRAPAGSRASGATKFIAEDKALMLLSFRYLSDDQFWFTVFHEAGHLVLHTDKGLFLEGSDFGSEAAENEADVFAQEHLFSGGNYDALSTVPLNKFSIGRLARRAGVSPGIVVGQLQKIGRTSHKYFNYMKVRYAWPD
jgi:plasmid maintenance system antidote protein VapI/Zn-dependent peptidase ImmA (M78 family)